MYYIRILQYYLTVVYQNVTLLPQFTSLICFSKTTCEVKIHLTKINILVLPMLQTFWVPELKDVCRTCRVFHTCLIIQVALHFYGVIFNIENSEFSDLHLQQYNFFCSGVIDRVISELKQILKRDFNKKMIENTAFKSFENWWDEQERKSKVRKLYFVISQQWTVCSDVQVC